MTERRVNFRPVQIGQLAASGDAELAESVGRAAGSLQQPLLNRLARHSQLRGAQEGEVAGAAGIPELRDGTNISDIAFNRAAIETYERTASIDLRDQIAAAEDEFGRDPEALREALEGIRQGTLENVPDERLASAITPRFDDLAGAAVIRARDRFKEDQRSDLKASVASDFNAMGIDLRNLARAGNVEGAMRQLDEMRALQERGSRAEAEGGLGILDPTKSAEALQKAERMLDVQLVVGAMESLPPGEQGAFVKAFLNDTPDDFPPELVDATVSEMEKVIARRERVDALAELQVTEEQARENERRASDLEIAVSRGEADEIEIDQAFEDDLITGAKRTQLFKELDRQGAVAAENAANSELVAAHIEAGVAFDLKNNDDRKLVDQYYQAQGIDPFTLEGRAQLTHMVGQLQVIPPSVKSQGAALLRSGDVNQAVAGAELFNDLMTAAPMTVDQLNTSEKAVASSINSMVNAGTDPEQAVEIARRNAFELSKAERDILDGRYTDDKGDPIDALDDFINEDIDTMFISQPEATTQLEAEFDTLARQYFRLNGGDIALANQSAWNDLRTVWGVSQINGETELMKHPPPVPRDMLEEELRQAGIDATDVRVVADGETARGGSYALMTVDENGFLDVIEDENGLPGRWTPELVVTPEVAEKRAVQRERAEMTRKLKAETPSFSPGDFTQ